MAIVCASLCALTAAPTRLRVGACVPVITAQFVEIDLDHLVYSAPSSARRFSVTCGRSSLLRPSALRTRHFGGRTNRLTLARFGPIAIVSCRLRYAVGAGPILDMAPVRPPPSTSAHLRITPWVRTIR